MADARRRHLGGPWTDAALHALEGDGVGGIRPSGQVGRGVGPRGPGCGSVAEHVHEMAKVLGKAPENEREWRSSTGKAMSAYEYYDHDADGGGSKGS